MARYLAAAVQMEVRVAEPDYNLRKALAMVDLAATNGARLVVLPECINVGYIFDSAEHCYDLSARTAPLFLERLGKAARENHLYIAVGLSEPAGGGFSFNSAFLLGPTGDTLGRWAKHFLVTHDWKWFVPSESGFPTFETELGKLGMFICGDARLAENARSLAVQGARVLLDLTNWIPPEQYLYNTPMRALENSAWVVAADKVGVERNLPYVGNSFIMSPLGDMVARASADQEEIIYGEIDPDLIARQPERDLLRLRRPESYGLLAQPTADLPIARLLDQPVVPGATTVNVAVVQPEARGKSREAALAEAIALVEDVARLNARIVVLPQGFLLDPAVPLSESVAAAEAIPGPTTEAMGRLAAATGCWLAYGLLERVGDAVYDTVVLASPDDPAAASYRRVHLEHGELSSLRTGDQYSVVETPWGRVGLMAGFDGWFPEVSRILMLKGADLLLWPTGWTSPLEPRYMAPERALGNRVFLVAASRSGGRYLGQSMIVDPRGNTLARMADGRQVLQAQLDLVQARCKEIVPHTSLVHNRRPELYGILCNRS